MKILPSVFLLLQFILTYTSVGALEPNPEAVDSWKIYIREPGIYVLGDSDLMDAGVDLSLLNPRKIALTNRGQEIPIYIHGEEDGRFDPGDYIEFYGTIYDEDYSQYNVYRLSVGAVDGLRIEVQEGRPSEVSQVSQTFLYTDHQEENKIRWSTFPGSETADKFFWQRIIAPKKQDFYVDAPYLANTREDVTLRLMVRGNIIGNHLVRVYFNDILMDEATWHGQTQYFAEVQMPQTFLKEEGNIVTLELPTEVDAIYLNWFELTYHRYYVTDDDVLAFDWPGGGSYRFHVWGFTQPDVVVLDITDPDYTIRVINPEVKEIDAGYELDFQGGGDAPKTYLTLTAAQKLKPVKIETDFPSDLHSTENGSDYIIITHADFYESILPLADLREQEGLRVKIVDVQDIYDEFNYGSASDTSIRDFLKYAYQNWIPPAPFCVLLVGDATYDHKDRYGLGDVNYMPTHLSLTPHLGDSANDNWFVDVDGDDALPEMMIGRLPAGNAAQAEAMVEKIINYEQNLTPGDWQRRILLVADDETAFTKQSEELAEKIPDGYQVIKAYLSETPPDEVAAMIVDTINEGCLILNYVGHGGWTDWAMEEVFETADIDLLNQTNALPLMLNATCLTGYFHHAQRDDILGENLIRAPGKGVIATFMPAGASGSSWQSMLNQFLVENLLTRRHRRLGTAVMEARVLLAASGMEDANPEIQNLLGDPALKLALPEPDVKWDVNGDKVVDFLDIFIAASRFGETITPLAYPNPDVNGDGVVDILDVIIIGTHFGEKSQ